MIVRTVTIPADRSTRSIEANTRSGLATTGIGTETETETEIEIETERVPHHHHQVADKKNDAHGWYRI